MERTLDSTEWLNERSKALVHAGQGIIEARRLLDQLDEILRGTAFGKFPDIGCVADLCHALGEAKNTILIGLVESSSISSASRQEGSAFMGDTK